MKFAYKNKEKRIVTLMRFEPVTFWFEVWCFTTRPNGHIKNFEKKIEKILQFTLPVSPDGTSEIGSFPREVVTLFMHFTQNFT